MVHVPFLKDYLILRLNPTLPCQVRSSPRISAYPEMWQESHIHNVFSFFHHIIFMMVRKCLNIHFFKKYFYSPSSELEGKTIFVYHYKVNKFENQC